MKKIKKVSFIGAGSMAEAIIEGLINKQVVNSEQIFVTNKENVARLTELADKFHINTSTNREDVISDADVIFIATKPYDVKQAVADIKEKIKQNQLLISVVAGISTELIAETVGKSVPVIRSMPNTSAAVGYSATAITKGRFATEEDLIIAKNLFEAIGTVSVVEEDHMHIVTALSGSGPAYVYYLVEAMEQIAQNEGLDKATAKQLIVQTVIGAGEMMKQTDESVITLRENVTSPNGTTAAGIKTLKEYQFKDAVMTCVERAKKRSVELGKE